MKKNTPAVLIMYTPMVLYFLAKGVEGGLKIIKQE
jgi:hypothetical protein